MILEVKNFVPNLIVSGILGNAYPPIISEHGDCIEISYSRPVSNHTKRTVGYRIHRTTLPKTVLADKQFYFVMGLLQGEMSKTNKRPLTFANSEPEIINSVLSWFSEEFHIAPTHWHWYLRLNIAKPPEDVHKVLESELVKHWLGLCPLSFDMRYNKTLTYSTTTKSSRNNSGTLMIERRNPIFVQTIQTLVQHVLTNCEYQDDEAIVAYLRGIIAAEGCINFQPNSGHFRVFISAKLQSERDVYKACLKRLGIECYDCLKIRTLVISRKENVKKLFDLGLITGSPIKLKRFLEMVNHYKTI
jgi:hypothetical protein